jgi:hypothetical protein
MDSNRSRAATLIGVAAAAGAFGVAAMMSAATAPTARADAFTNIINSVDADLGAGQSAFTLAASDFGSNELAPGLAAFFNGVNDDALSAPNTLLIGSVEALANEPIIGIEPWGLTAPTDFSDALTNVEAFISQGEGDFTVAASDLASGDYGDAAVFGLFGVDAISIAPLEELLLGAAASL